MIGQHLFVPGAGEQLLLLPEQLLLGDPQVLEPRALAAPLGRDVLTLTSRLLHLLAVVGEAELVQACRQAAPASGLPWDGMVQDAVGGVPDLWNRNSAKF